MEDRDWDRPLACNEIEVQTHAIGMNFKDCLTALGQASNSTFGLECAGIVTRIGEEGDLMPGDRVLMVAAGTFKTLARGKLTAACKVPEGMLFAEAAAIPAQFGTAWEAVHELARL